SRKKTWVPGASPGTENWHGWICNRYQPEARRRWYMFDLTGQTALVTGASGGIGGAAARALHRQGAVVTLTGTRAAALQALAEELGERAHVVTADLADPAAADALIRDAE